MKQLSILILSLPTRIESYCWLIKELDRQIVENGLTDKVQVLSLLDTKEMSVGNKRNSLLQISVGKYVMFIDDDDRISPNYIKKIYESTLSNADVVTFCGEYIENNIVTPFSISLLHRDNINEPTMFYRLPNHLCAVKRDIAIECQFSDKNFGEDSDYSSRINCYLKNEYHINEKLYFYMYNSLSSQTKPDNNLTGFSL